MFLTTIIKSGSTVVHRGHRLAGSVRVPILAHWPLGWGGVLQPAHSIERQGTSLISCLARTSKTLNQQLKQLKIASSSKIRRAHLRLKW